jgi:predicted O-methyltransferase YrrM
METKPIFTGQYIAFSEFDRVALRALIQTQKRPDRTMIEIGSWLGNGSTRVFIEEIRASGGVLYAVDTWKGNPNVEKHQALVAQYNAFETFRHHVGLAGGEALVKPLVMASRDAAPIMADRRFDLVFIDADHSYPTTREDIQLWLPKVRPGGILCGHDCEGRPGDFDREVLLRRQLEDTAPGNATFPIVHPGPILAVDEMFGGRAQLWATTKVQTPDGRLGGSSIWFVQVA